MVSMKSSLPPTAFQHLPLHTLFSCQRAMASSQEPISQNPSNGPSKKLQFKGWRQPQKKWKQWVDKLSLKNEATWKKSGIFDAVMASTHKITRDEALVIGLSEFWCPTTNTFVFTWGEATLTLEDMFFLCGYSVLGLPVTDTNGIVTGKLLEIKDKMTQKHKWLSSTEAKKANCSSWMNYFMEISIHGDGDDLEHVGFLILWLSRYVFPAYPQDTVGKHVFSIAILLAQGTRIAIAPAVLSSLYRDLRLLNQHVIDGFDCSLWAPVRIVQLWAWKRFLPLRPVGGTTTSRGARRHKLSSNKKLPFVRSVLRSVENFQWQCYDTNDEGNGVWCSSDPTLACELVGIDCKEKYFPSRVLKQFRIDEKLIKKKIKGTSQVMGIDDELEEFEIDDKLKKKKEMECSSSRNNKEKKLDEKVRNLGCSLSNDSIDHLTLYERLKLLQRGIQAEKNLSTKPPSSSVQSQTSRFNSTVMSELKTTCKSSMEDLSVDECNVLESRVMQLEKEIAGIKARLKARATTKGKEQM